MYRDDEELGIGLIALVICLVITICVARGCASMINGANCKADAQALKIRYEYHGNWMAKDKCVYILPNGKRILSTQYRGME